MFKGNQNTKMKRLLIRYLILILSFSLFSAQSKEGGKKQKKSTINSLTKEELEVVDFKSVKKVLKDDHLDTELEKKKQQLAEEEKLKEEQKRSGFFFPSEDDFWSHFSEYWLINKASYLSWDFKKPDYGLDDSLSSLLNTLGLFGEKFKILLLNTPVVAHMGLPGKDKDSLLLLSVPFIRTMDLTKLEISLLLLEDIFRLKEKYFIEYVKSDDLNKSYEQNFYDKGFDKKSFQETLKKYDEFALKKGFNFKQQFKITKKMDEILRSHPALWQAYYRLNNKMDNLVKTDLLFKDYVKIYPSPELKIKWLTPEKNSL